MRPAVRPSNDQLPILRYNNWQPRHPAELVLKNDCLLLHAGALGFLRGSLDSVVLPFFARPEQLPDRRRCEKNGGPAELAATGDFQ